MDAPSNGKRPIHPGKIPHEEFLLPMGMSAEFWRGVQADFDMARAYDTLAGEPAAIDPWQTQQFA